MDLNIKLNTIIRAPEESKDVVERLTKENINHKINSYLKKFEGKDVEGLIEIIIDKTDSGFFNGKLKLNISGESFRYEREDYKNLDDLVNNLFKHFKEELAKK